MRLIQTVYLTNGSLLLFLPLLALTAPATQSPVSPQETFQRAQAFYHQNDFAQAVPLLTQAAQQGLPNAQGLLGSMYLIGKGVAKDFPKALTLLKQAATQGHAEAQSLIGAIYLVGKEVPQDVKQAVQWLQKAAGQGLADAQYLLGALYVEGNGVPRNLEYALELLSKAGDQGHQPAKVLQEKVIVQLFPPAQEASVGKPRLTVKVTPPDSQVKILNISPKYVPGMELAPGKYQVLVSRAGYKSKRVWVEVKEGSEEVVEEVMLTK